VRQYAAFISYSHSDTSIVRWLHHALETYRLPKILVGSDSPFGPVPRKLPPVFRDRDELPASGDLGSELRAALTNSRFQIVVCSPRSAKSHWVNEEIKHFKRSHGEFRTLALIVEGEPYSGGDQECFPPALRFRLDADGEVSDVPAEPIAADIRPGKDGRRLALLKLIAGITGLRLDALARRDAARRQRELTIITAISLSIAVVTIGLAIYADLKRREAVEQKRLAEKTLNFMVDTFQIANPATENPHTITVLTVLDRVAKRAATELSTEPEAGAKLLGTTSEIYYKLGLSKEADRDARATLRLEPAKSEGRATAYVRLAKLAIRRGASDEAAGFLAQAEKSYDPTAVYAPKLDAQIAEQNGMVMLRDGKYASAADKLGKAVTLFEQLTNDDRENLATVLMNQGRALVYTKNYAAAEAVLARAQALFAAQYGINHVRTANAIQNSAWARFEAGQFAEADPMAAQAVRVYSRVLEGDHPTLAAMYILQGRIKTSKGDPAGALLSFDKAREMYARLYGADNVNLGDVDFFAGEAEAKRGDIDAALRRFAHTKVIYDAAYGPVDPDQVELLMARARAFAGAKRMVDALHNCESAIALQIKLDSHDVNLAKLRQQCETMRRGAPAGT